MNLEKMFKTDLTCGVESGKTSIEPSAPYIARQSRTSEVDCTTLQTPSVSQVENQYPNCVITVLSTQKRRLEVIDAKGQEHRVDSATAIRLVMQRPYVPQFGKGRICRLVEIIPEEPKREKCYATEHGGLRLFQTDDVLSSVGVDVV